jgi:hypothetical protein
MRLQAAVLQQAGEHLSGTQPPPGEIPLILDYPMNSSDVLRGSE